LTRQFDLYAKVLRTLLNNANDPLGRINCGHRPALRGEVQRIAALTGPMSSAVPGVRPRVLSTNNEFGSRLKFDLFEVK